MSRKVESVMKASNTHSKARKAASKPVKAPVETNTIIVIPTDTATTAIESAPVESALTTIHDPSVERRAMADDAGDRAVEAAQRNPGSPFAKMVAMVYRDECRRGGNPADGGRLVAQWLYREATARANHQDRSAFSRVAWQALKGFLRSTDSKAAQIQGASFAAGLRMSDSEARDLANAMAANSAIKADAARHRRFAKDEAKFRALAGHSPATVAIMLDDARFAALVATAERHLDNGRKRAGMAAAGRAATIASSDQEMNARFHEVCGDLTNLPAE
jgi:hypothetical protein